MGKIKLFCFAHAGGSASIYIPWTRMITKKVNVEPIEYPGRGFRAKEPLCTDIKGIVESVYDSITSKLDESD
jgi:surfactin synthase thioesterase subunit